MTTDECNGQNEPSGMLHFISLHLVRKTTPSLRASSEYAACVGQSSFSSETIGYHFGCAQQVNIRVIEVH